MVRKRKNTAAVRKLLSMGEKCEYCPYVKKNFACCIIEGKYVCEWCRPKVSAMRTLKLRPHDGSPKKTRKIHFKCTPEEHAQLKKMAQRMKISLQDLVSVALYGRDGRS